jgi:hypothetical protein
MKKNKQNRITEALMTDFYSSISSFTYVWSSSSLLRHTQVIVKSAPDEASPS